MSIAIVQGDLAALTVHLEKAAVAPAPAPAAAAPSAPSIPDLPRSLDVLRAMLALPRVTADELRVTSAGKLVQRLSKSTEAALSALAKELLAKWKAQVLPPPSSGPTGVEKAKMEAAAAAQKALADSRAAAKKKAEAAAATAAAATAAAAKKADASDDSDSDGEGKKKGKKDKKRRDKEESVKKRSKTDDASQPAAAASAVSRLVAASKNEKSLAAQHPHLTSGPYALFATDDELRDKMQLMFWQAIGEPSAAVIAQTAAATGDLDAYKPAHHKNKDESKTTGTPSLAPSPSPPPIASISLASPLATADSAEAASAASSSAAPASPAPSAAASSSAPVFRSRIELAFLIEQAMFVQLGPSSSTAYRQKYRDLAPQLKDPSNQDLNADLFLNRITPDDLIVMTSQQLAPSSMKEKRAKEAKWAREAARSDLTIGDGATDAFLCEACAEAGRPGRRCVFFQQQTRGADEPMTIFVTCLDCGNKFRSGDGER